MAGPNPFVGGGSSGGSSSGGGNPFTGGSSSGNVAFSTQKIKKVLRNSVAAGDVEGTRKAAKAAGFGPRDVKALVAVAGLNHPKGFLGRLSQDVGDTIKGTAKGVPALAVAAGKDVFGPMVRPIIAGPAHGFKKGSVSGEVKKNAADVAAGVDRVQAIKGGLVQGGDVPDANHPFFSGAAQSMHRTGVRLTHPKQFIHDYSQRPFSSLVEDAANAAIVAAPAASALGAAGEAAAAADMAKTAAVLNTSSRVLGTTGEAANMVAGAPFAPTSLLARGLNEAVPQVLDRLNASEHFRPIMEYLRQTPEQKATKEVLRAQHEGEAGVTNRIARDFAKQEKAIGTDVFDQEAMYLTGQGQVSALAKAREALPPEQFNKMVADTLGKDFAPESVNRAIDAYTGKNPELAARIDEALRLGEAGRAQREAGYLSRNASREVQTGFGPIPEEVARRTAKLNKRLERAVRMSEKAQLAADANRGRLAAVQQDAEFLKVPSVQRPRSGDLGPSLHPASDVKLSERLGKEQAKQAALDRRATQAQRVVDRLVGKVDSTVRNAEYSLAAAPARLRPVLETNRAVVSALTEHENALRAAGLDASVIAPIAEDIPVTLAALEAAGVNPEHFINPQARLTEGASVPGGNRVNLPRTKKLDEARFRSGKGAHEMTVRAQARAEISRTHQVLAEQTVRELEQLPFVSRGADHVVWGPDGPRMPTRAELHAQGLESWAPGSLFEVAPKVGADTLILPKAVHEAFKTYWEPRRWEKLFEHTLDPLTRGFKMVVLPLSVAWNVGNAITNAFMAVGFGGESPMTLVAAIRDSVKARRATGDWVGPQRLYESGATHESLDFLGGRQLQGGKIRRVARMPVNAGYRLNEFTDNMFRSAVYLAKKGRGYSDEAAMRLSLRAMGDFTAMSPFERSVVRRTVPFYAWLRHMTQASLRLPIEHPFRTAWILNMSNVFKQQDAWEQLLPGYMQGFLPLGGGSTLGVANFMPFSDPLTAITHWGANLNPVIKFGLANIPGSPMQGINPMTGAPYTRRPGTGRLDEYGNPLPTSPSLVEQLRGIPPQVRMLDSLLGRKDVARYQSGQVVMVRGKDGKLHPIPTPKTPQEAVLRYMGVPTSTKQQLKQIVDSKLYRQVQAWKSAHPQANTKKKSSSGSSSNPFVGK